MNIFAGVFATDLLLFNINFFRNTIKCFLQPTFSSQSFKNLTTIDESNKFVHHCHLCYTFLSLNIADSKMNYLKKKIYNININHVKIYYFHTFVKKIYVIKIQYLHEQHLFDLL